MKERDKVEAFQIYVNGEIMQIAPFDSIVLANRYIDRFKAAVPGKYTVKPTITTHVRLIHEFEVPKTVVIKKSHNKSGGYDPKKCCTKFGKKHQFELSASNKTLRCTVCSSVKGVKTK